MKTELMAQQDGLWLAIDFENGERSVVNLTDSEGEMRLRTDLVGQTLQKVWRELRGDDHSGSTIPEHASQWVSKGEYDRLRAIYDDLVLAIRALPSANHIAGRGPVPDLATSGFRGMD